jgi:hypothetical protein
VAGSHVATYADVVGTVLEDQSVDATSTNHLDFQMFVDFLVIYPLVDLKTVEQDVNATEIVTLTGIITGRATEVTTIPNSETVIKNCSKASIR